MAEAFTNVTEGSGKKLHGWDRSIGGNTVIDEFVIPGEYPYPSYTVIAAAISIATAADHVLQIMAGSSLTVRIRRITATQHGLATTAGLTRFLCVRLTTAGTGGTSVTPRQLDSADAASGATAMTLPTAKGTEGNTIRQDSVHMLQTISATPPNRFPLFDWDFDRPRVKPLMIAAGTSNGIAVKVVDAIAAASINLYVELVETSFV